ncbi:kinase-like domain-containing protein [Dunaliella salina]|uniref:Kinase-like domain-containing protein n=1 Tax=Dunaliella salina TaxID=3046 RepID=A0ABQ7GRT2_DUNSA|nr:kinase-like domain-containing protein [Dunaliella salina]|eukprot:KAF5837307.1 kinase-like domain-containing protein [Dunaliella salina]
MGCFSSKESKYDPKGTEAKQKSVHNKSTHANKAVAKRPNAPPDFGLSASHEVLKLLGRGGEGETWLFRDKASGALTAIKLIKRPIPKPAIAVIKREIRIQADLGQGHLNIVSAEEVILSRTHLGLIMEFVPVRYLHKHHVTHGERSVVTGAMGCCHLWCCHSTMVHTGEHFTAANAVWYLHEHHVTHWDLKLDNTLLDHHNPPWLKLCDFGFAKHWNANNSNMDTMRIGTPEYMGPELISSRTGYDGKKVDVWAAGVLLFVMLAGVFPFETQDDNFNNTAGLYDIWLQQIKTSWRDLPNNGAAVMRLSPELKDLLDKMFEVKQDSRIGIDTIKAHPWFKKPLLPKYAAALATLSKAQAAIDEACIAAAGQSGERDKALEQILDRAANQALPTEDVTRLGLITIKPPGLEDEAGDEGPTHPPQMGTLPEDSTV